MPRLPKGISDPVSFTCTCPAATSNDGVVLLFYRYFAASPSLPERYGQLPYEPSMMASFHTEATQKYSLGGKIRVGTEGFNVTVGGTAHEIQGYIEECVSHWSFAGLSLETDDERREFFKPTPGGCACVFGGSPASVRVTAEITPMGVTNYLPERWDRIESLSPEQFHERCHSDPEILLLDVRNYYESRIGYFVDPKTGEAALRPPIRRFSQWPQYVKKYMAGPESRAGGQGRHIMTYCTGGIRCEKGARWMEENMDKRDGDRVCTLKGGIAAYLAWIDEETKAGRKRPEDSLFRGKNYVFDARGSTGLNLDTAATDPVSNCHMCAAPSARLSKCRSAGCHLVLVICSACEEADPRCCQSCLDFDKLPPELDSGGVRTARRPICACEKGREAQLWGGSQQSQGAKASGQRRGLKDGNGKARMDIQVKIVS